MNKIDIRSLFVPFCGSIAHKVCAVLGALIVAVGLILGAHFIMHRDVPQGSGSSVSESEAAK